MAGINKNSNSYQALWVGIGSLSSFALAIVSAAVLSRFFEKTEYGTYRQILFVYNSLLVVFSAQLPKVFSYYLPKFDLEKGKDIVARITLLLFATGVLFSAFLYFGSNLIAFVLKNEELSTGLKYFSPIPMLLLPTLGLQGILSTYRKTNYLAFYQICTRIIMLLFIVVPVVYFENSYIFAIYGWMGASILSLFIALYVKSLPFRGVKRQKSGLTTKKILNYSLPLVGAGIAGIAIKSADQFFISRYFGAEVFAEFANGFIPIPIVAMVTSATSIVLMPVFSKITENKDNLEELVTLWKSALTKSAVIVYPIVFFMFYHADNIIEILYGVEYANSATYFRIAMVLNFFNIVVFAPLLLSLGKSKFYSYIHIYGAIVVWVLGFLVVSFSKNPFLLALSSTFVSVGIIVIGYIYSAKLLKISFLEMIPVNEVFKLVIHLSIAIALLAIVDRLIDVSSSILVLVYQSFLYALLLLSTDRFFGLKYIQVMKPFMKRF